MGMLTKMFINIAPEIGAVDYCYTINERLFTTILLLGRLGN